MNGQEYEQFVRAVIARRCRIDPARITSTRLPGAILPGSPQVRHQVDLFFTERIGDADYLTIIECKYHESSKVGQEDVAKLAHTKLSLRAAKAILVTNTAFTSGADALATSERIALVVAPVNERFRTEYSRLVDAAPQGETDVIALFDTILAAVDKAGSGDVVVVQRRFAGTGADAGGLLGELLSDPGVRQAARDAMRGPTVRKVVEDFARSNPDIFRKALDQFKRWPR